MKLVQISTLGRNGRFGNQLFQYAFARTYAEHVGAILETPPWIGQELFGLHDPPISCMLPQRHESEVPSRPDNWVAGVDLLGWFQIDRLLASVSQSAVRRWFTLQPRWQNWFPKKRLYYAACHLRQGDFSTDAGNYCIISRASYVRAIRQFVPHDCCTLWVEEDSPEVCEGLPPELAFLPDFMTLWRADILLRANSTFSWWAGELGQHFAIYSPVVAGRHGPCEVQFVLGNEQRHADFPGHGKLRFGQP